MLSMANLMISYQKIRSPVRCILARSWHKDPIPVAWEKPELGWTKLNFDGSCKGRDNRASIGGVFRNHKAEFMLGYAESIGRTTSTIAEIAALRRGLELSLENGWSNVWLEGDAKTLVDILEHRKRIKSLEVQKHVSEIKLIIPELDSCILTFIYREGNRVADKFAQLGHRLDQPRIWMNDPPKDVMRIVHEDSYGKIIFRRR